MNSVREILKELTQKLSQSDIPRASREAQLLVMAYLQKDELWLLTNSDFIIDDTTQLFRWLQRRQNDEPFEYIVNSVSFYSEEFYIAKGALIPRPETEILIDEILARVDFHAPLLFVEVGVGSGIISIMLAKKLPHATFIAVDISQEALEIAKINIKKFNLEERIELRLGSLLDNVTEDFDYLVSNPPYIAEDAPLENNLSFEPQNALFGGKIGDEIIQKLLDEVLKRKIKFFSCEMGYDQKDKITHYLQDKKYKSLEFYKDWSDFDRGFTLRIEDE
jgi:release factor glutamine methyltransferase